MIKREDLIRRICREGCVDTRNYRYIIDENYGAVIRKELSRLDTTGALEPWEVVWDLRTTEQMVREITALPIARPVRKGHWIDKDLEGAWNCCSVCGERAIDLYDFCPNCGADMREEDIEDV